MTPTSPHPPQHRDVDEGSDQNTTPPVSGDLATQKKNGRAFSDSHITKDLFTNTFTDVPQAPRQLAFRKTTFCPREEVWTKFFFFSILDRANIMSRNCPHVPYPSIRALVTDSRKNSDRQKKRLRSLRKYTCCILAVILII